MTDDVVSCGDGSLPFHFQLAKWLAQQFAAVRAHVSVPPRPAPPRPRRRSQVARFAGSQIVRLPQISRVHLSVRVGLAVFLPLFAFRDPVMAFD